MSTPTPTFCKTLRKEQHKIRARCDEIDEIIRTLEGKRKAIEECDEALESVQGVYHRSQQTVDVALTALARLSDPDTDVKAKAESRYWPE